MAPGQSDDGSAVRTNAGYFARLILNVQGTGHSFQALHPLLAQSEMTHELPKFGVWRSSQGFSIGEGFYDGMPNGLCICALRLLKEYLRYRQLVRVIQGAPDRTAPMHWHPMAESACQTFRILRGTRATFVLDSPPGARSVLYAFFASFTPLDTGCDSLVR